ncbi:cytochrome-c oxidase, cbb3-type subunit III [Sulfitobacter guttiformis]|uniref:Cbb3-type cytochrome c oxidase subunit n=1 Tax=Sulfitobacter guttiformis TaxID=74349 RepID=A0A420DJG9_9RHOB|nr:cytochrome-c oxidase, cbb3-type subunit III [Sulfitobacter guttiformis]KIN71823.1 Cbb3-type cytochrome c oxidase subunit [Sulfitobacter guttiformis KCTC 32187]RKE94362.1 cytochrome c oxidase cbb3-type subunit 3 [Sulfitobacter guttiformis]
MSVKDRDPLTGHQTTGHEWNGITELNTRVPRAVWFFIILTHIWALVMWVLLPSWPLVTTYTKGILGLDQRVEVEEKIIAANMGRSAWADRIAVLPASEILGDPAMMTQLNGTAHQLFGDNCAGCHGRLADGGPGFPSLVDGAWLWGGDTESIMETLRVGINATHPDTRWAQMLAFGRDGILPREDIRTVVDYVQSLSGEVAQADTIAAGSEIFADNCASCHGDSGAGNTDVGAPDLTDDFWIYGGDDESMFTTIWEGRQGWMPAWEGRMTETERKVLAVYLQGLGQEVAQ